MTSYDSHLSAEEISAIEQEQAILNKVIEEIKRHQFKDKLNRHKIGNSWKALRDEAANAKDADLPALFDQMHAQRAIIEHTPDHSTPDIRSPYFARMRLLESGKSKDVLIGFCTFLDTLKLPIIDWRHAPVSKIFFNYRVGEDYEEDLPNRTAIGEVLVRNILTIQDGNIVHLATADGSYRLGEDKKWRKETGANFVPTLVGGEGAANRQMTLGSGMGGLVGPQVSALLDKEQFEILNSDPNEPLMILGSAGCGKTTVALHRMALLNFQDRKRYPESAMGLIVPEEGLVRLSRKLLSSLGLHKVLVSTFDTWIEKQARNLIRGLPKKVNHSAPGNVIRFKRSPHITNAFPLLVEQNRQSIVHSFKKKFNRSDIDGLFLQDDRPIFHQLQSVEESLVSAWQQDGVLKSKLKQLQSFFKDQRRILLNLESDRHDLLTMSRYLEKIVESSHGELPEHLIKDVLRHSMDQFQERNKEYDGVDKQRLTAIDGQSILDAMDDNLSGSIDSEDFAILLELLYFKTGMRHSPYGKLDRFQHLVLDEAQELAPLELNCLSRSLKSHSTMTIAGDSAQQTDPTTTFKSWGELIRRLLPECQSEEASQKQAVIVPNELMTNYRSTKQIADVAYQILGPMAGHHRPVANREGLPVSQTLFPSEGHLSIFLSEALSQLFTHEPNCSVAIICQSQETASRIYASLKHLPKIRLVLEGEFSFKPGIDITDVSQVKGLEFDYVIVPDASIGVYRDCPEHRRTLHVAVTRAIHQLWIASVVKKSPIVEAIVTTEVSSSSGA